MSVLERIEKLSFSKIHCFGPKTKKKKKHRRIILMTFSLLVDAKKKNKDYCVFFILIVEILAFY